MKVFLQKVAAGVTAVAFSVVLAAVIVFGAAYLAMLFWNMFCSYANLPEIGFWQMWGLMMFLQIVVATNSMKVDKGK